MRPCRALGRALHRVGGNNASPRPASAWLGLGERLQERQGLRALLRVSRLTSWHGRCEGARAWREPGVSAEGVAREIETCGGMQRRNAGSRVGARCRHGLGGGSSKGWNAHDIRLRHGRPAAAGSSVRRYMAAGFQEFTTRATRPFPLSPGGPWGGRTPMQLRAPGDILGGAATAVTSRNGHGPGLARPRRVRGVAMGRSS